MKIPSINRLPRIRFSITKDYKNCCHLKYKLVNFIWRRKQPSKIISQQKILQAQQNTQKNLPRHSFYQVKLKYIVDEEVKKGGTYLGRRGRGTPTSAACSESWLCEGERHDPSRSRARAHVPVWWANPRGEVVAPPAPWCGAGASSIIHHTDIIKVCVLISIMSHLRSRSLIFPSTNRWRPPLSVCGHSPCFILGPQT